MELHFLEASLPLSKTYKKVGDKFEKNQYPIVKKFTSHTEQASTLQEFLKALRYHGHVGHCLLKGKLQKDLENESRAGSTNPYDKTEWLCLDLDYFEDESKMPALLASLGLGNVSYIIQYSSGHKIDKPFGAHLFMLLDRPVLPEQLKLWLMDKNLEIKELNNMISLTRANAALRWPLDISVAQNDKLIYLSPPTCLNFDDPLKERVYLKEDKLWVAPIADEVDSIDAAVVQEKKSKKLAALRKDKGLPARKLQPKIVNGVEVVKNPGSVTVTGQKQERGFVYLNINGGDSWGYFHPVDNPEIIHNFKGEPNYLTKELLPEYYKAYKKLLRDMQKEEDSGTHYFAFLDRRTDKYYRGSFTKETEELELFPTNSVKKVEDFLKQHGQFVGDYIEEWDYEFRFEDNRVFVPEKRFVNRFVPTPYLRAGKEANSPKRFPPTIGKILLSLAGNDKKVVKHFLNWLAFIIQERERTQTAWVFNGVEGTGKGLLVHNILTPIFGKLTVQVKSLSNLEEDFNAYMEQCVFLMLDESKRTQLRNPEKAMAKLKQAITDPVVPIRRMQTDHYMTTNYMNVIVTSNHQDPIYISASDRRFNVGAFQHNKLQMTDKEIASIDKELDDFTALLYNMKVDYQAVRTPLENQARSDLKFITQTSLEVTFAAFMNGDLYHFIEHLPTNRELVGGMDIIEVDKVVKFMREAEEHADKGRPHVISRDEMYMLMQYVLGDMPPTVNRFTNLVKHHGIQFSRVRIGNRRVPGLTVEWNKSPVRVDDMVGESQQQMRVVK